MTFWLSCPTFGMLPDENHQPWDERPRNSTTPGHAARMQPNRKPAVASNPRLGSPALSDSRTPYSKRFGFGEIGRAKRNPQWVVALSDRSRKATDWSFLKERWLKRLKQQNACGVVVQGSWCNIRETWCRATLYRLLELRTERPGTTLCFQPTTPP